MQIGYCSRRLCSLRLSASSNRLPKPCSLSGIPTVVLTAIGIALPIERRPPSQASQPSLVVAARSSSWVNLTVYWSNWCRPDPGPLRVSVTLAGNEGTLSAPFDGPPDYNYVPPCLALGQPSTVVVLGYSET